MIIEKERIEQNLIILRGCLKDKRLLSQHRLREILARQNGGEVVEKFAKRILSPSKQYKVEIMKRHDGLYTTEVFTWIEWDEDYVYEYWSPINQGLSLIDTEEEQ